MSVVRSIELERPVEVPVTKFNRQGVLEVIDGIDQAGVRRRALEEGNHEVFSSEFHRQVVTVFSGGHAIVRSMPKMEIVRSLGLEESAKSITRGIVVTVPEQTDFVPFTNNFTDRDATVKVFGIVVFDS